MNCVSDLSGFRGRQSAHLLSGTTVSACRVRRPRHASFCGIGVLAEAVLRSGLLPLVGGSARMASRRDKGTVIQISHRIVSVNVARCDGCGTCASHCRQGALRLADDGKATLVADHLCDGLGTCVEACPRGALMIEHRQAGIHVNDQERLDAAPEPDGGALLRWRLDLCCTASKCGRLCSRLVKQPGKAGVYCVDVRTGQHCDLYESLAEPDFVCPEGLF